MFDFEKIFDFSTFSQHLFSNNFWFEEKFWEENHLKAFQYFLGWFLLKIL